MKIIQILPTIAFGDAVSNDAIMLKEAIQKMGYSTNIYADIIDSRLPNKTALQYSNLKSVNKDDIIIYHKSTGTDLSFELSKFDCRKIMIYHNITPPEFFEEYNPTLTNLVKYGYEGLNNLKDKIDYCLAVSEYNKKDLIRYGYTCPIDVRPILIKFEDYKQKSNETIINKYSSDGYVNLLFVGRIAPNKKQENVIRAFYEYHKINPLSRLFLVGSDAGLENYSKRLKDYSKALGINDSIIFTGSIKFPDILAYYKIADAFLCMSEHEGFCVPLVEAMFFDVPIVAYNTSAISDTLNGSGILLDDNNPLYVAKTLDYLLTHEGLKDYIIQKQRKRLDDFSYENTLKLFREQLNSFIFREGNG